MSRVIEVRVAAPVEQVYAYLADPINRPEWQSSLSGVRMLTTGEPQVGTRWIDVTAVPGVRPRMEITEDEPGRRWAETGTWRGITADLVLRFAVEGGQTVVRATFDLRATGLWRLPASAAQILAPTALGSDLRRAAKILEQRHG